VWGGHLSQEAVIALSLGALLAVVLSAANLLRGPHRRYWGGLLALRTLAISACLIVALEPSFELRQITRIPNHIAILVDASRSMTVSPPDASENRFSRALSLLRDAKPTLDKWQQAGHQVDIFRFGAGITASALPDVGGAPDEMATRLGESLEELSSRYAGRDVGAVVLITDGIDTGRLGTGPIDDETLAAMNSLEAPVHTVFIGEDRLRDLSVSSVLSDDFAFVRTPIKLDALIRHAGLGNRQVEVTLRRDGRLIDSKTVKLTGDASEARVSFPFTPQKPGNSVFEIATPVLRGEALKTNNRKIFTLKIIRDRVRVLHVAGRPSWDERFLRALLRLDPNVDLVSFFILRTEEDARPFDQRALSLIPFPHQEIFSDQLASFDLLVFQNFDYGPYRVEPFLPGVADYVMSGGALVMIGGDRAFASGDYGRSALNPILPVDLAGVPSTEAEAFIPGTFKPRLTAAGTSHPVTSLSLDPEVNAKLWQSLPALEGANRVAATKPDATALMVHPTDTTAQGTPAPIVAVRDAGRGRTMAVLTDTAWHWGFLAAGAGNDERAFQRFWERAIRWLVRDPTLTLLQLELDRAEYTQGQPAVVRVRTLHADYTPAPEVDVSLQLVRSGRETQRAGETDTAQTATGRPGDTGAAAVRERPLRTGATGQGQIELDDITEGAYRLRARATIDGRELTEEKAFVVRAQGRELEDVVARPELLESLAKAGKGRAVSNTLRGLPAKPLREERLGDLEVVEIGTHPALLAAALLLLCLEWALRRQAGHR